MVLELVNTLEMLGAFRTNPSISGNWVWQRFPAADTKTLFPTLAYDIDQAVKRAILELESQGITYDKSELMEDLLTGWLAWYQSGGSVDDYMKTRTPRG